MTDFDTLNELFEKGKDFYKLFSDYGDDAIRYSLLRSLDNQNIKEFLGNRIDTSDTKKLLRNAYNSNNFCFIIYDFSCYDNSNVTISEVENYIMSKKEAILNERRLNEEVLINIVEDMDIVNCGIRNDQVDDIIKPFVRKKDFNSVDDINNELDNDLLPRIRNYIYWSCFNQLSNDLIENSFYSHPSIIPTLRKIHDIDFFIKIEGKIIPFDLKITHISDEFFNKYSEGLVEENNNDTYISNNRDSEIKKIKKYYSSIKNEYNLQNYGGLSKIELLEILKNLNDEEINEKIDEFYNNRKNMIFEIQNNIKPLEWWNYKFQGERLFSNNNRLFVFLAHLNDFKDGKDLKKDITDIRSAITSKLDNLTLDDIHTINYVYEKDPKVNGNYSINCISILITKE